MRGVVAALPVGPRGYGQVETQGRPADDAIHVYAD